MISMQVLNCGVVGVRDTADSLLNSIPTAFQDSRQRLSQPNSLRTEIPPSRQLEAGEGFDEDLDDTDDDY